MPEVTTIFKSISLVKKALSLHSDRKTKLLIDRINNAGITLNVGEVEKNQLLSTFRKTQRALENTEGTRKLSLLCDFYIASIQNNSIYQDPDRYCEIIQSLGEMSDREIRFVYILNTLESLYLNNSEIDFDTKITKEMEQKLNLNRDEMEAITRKLYSTGFVTSVSAIGGNIWPRTTTLYKDVLTFMYQYIDTYK